MTETETYRTFFGISRPLFLTESLLRVTESPLRVTESPLKVTESPLKVTESPLLSAHKFEISVFTIKNKYQ
ncbi:MAG: hypothetical protein LBP85_03000 [Prevotellaceae bacterium]|nr:hypothetical protein [Prevotellaceae bacterium]